MIYLSQKDVIRDKPMLTKTLTKEQTSLYESKRNLFELLNELFCSKSVPNSFKGAQTLDFTVFFSCVNLRIF